MTISPDNIHLDYAGTSPASAHGINVVMNYTLAYTAFGVKCLVAPEVPNSAGSLAPITASAPEGCVLNVKRPRAVAARHTVGHMLPDLVFGCLHQIMEGGVPAEGASSLWNPQIYGGADLQDELGAESGVPPFSTVIFHCGGAGARPGKDGLDVTAFPSGVRTIPVEATESVAPMIFPRREFREGSGGAGRHRGGLERLNQELKRRTHVVRIFPNAESCYGWCGHWRSRPTRTGSKRPDISTWSIRESTRRKHCGRWPPDGLWITLRVTHRPNHIRCQDQFAELDAHNWRAASSPQAVTRAPPGERVRCVPGMLNSLEVKVLYPT